MLGEIKIEEIRQKNSEKPSDKEITRLNKKIENVDI